jgi:uncharacterized membrane protein YoaK (UPF0700 family)
MSSLDVAAGVIRRDETVEIVLLLAFVEVVHGVMANAKTANLILLWVYATFGDWTKAFHFMPPFFAFAFGMVVVAWRRRAISPHRQVVK